jgi:hypothetical protein
VGSPWYEALVKEDAQGREFGGGDCDTSYVYWRDSKSAQNYCVALHSVRTECRIYIFPMGRRKDEFGLVDRNVKVKVCP